jgi:aerobic carbon-monoxide dehydrogenase large subunit
MPSPKSPFIFTPLRREDPALLSGRGLFTSDVEVPGLLHGVFVRSQHAAGQLLRVDCAAAMARADVVAVLTAQSLLQDHRLPCMPTPNPLLPVQMGSPFPVLAHQSVAYVGQPIALVVARSLCAAQQAARALQVRIAPQVAAPDAVVGQPVCSVTHCFDAATAMRDAPTPSSPHATQQVRVALELPRVLAMSMEPRAMVAQWDDEAQHLTVWLGTQTPSRAQADLAAALDVSMGHVRVIAGAVGGAFGAKSSLCPEDIVLALAAQQLKAAVRWVSSRADEFTSGMQGRGARLAGTLSVTPQGSLCRLDAWLDFTLGAWLAYSAVVPLRNAARILPGPYRVQHLRVQGQASMSSTAPVTIYRGAGRPEAALLMETLVEQAARSIGMDVAQLRRRNLVASCDMPYTTPTGELLDSGDYLRALDMACERFDYAAQRAEQTRRRAAGEVLGIGMALYVEPCGVGWESARVTLHSDGTANVASGSPAQGQGHGSTYARIAALALDIAEDKVAVEYGDTAHCPAGVGALASRSTAIAGSAIVQACQELRSRQQAGEALPLETQVQYAAAEAWSYGCVIARMAVQRDTGQTTIEQIVWVDDAGTVIHPELAQGQLIGGLAQGLGQAMMEQLVYDHAGQLLTGSLMDYAVPRAQDMPPISLHSFSTPSPHNLLGAKGVGEAGCIGVPAALMNAARDALSPLGECALQFPLTSEQLWRAMHGHPAHTPY